MSRTTARLERILGHEGLARLAVEYGGAVIRVPAASTVARQPTIRAAHQALDAGSTYRAVAAKLGRSRSTVGRYGKRPS